MGAPSHIGDIAVAPRESAAAAQDLQALQEAFELYARTAQSMEESYRRLEERVRTLDRELQERNRELAVTTDYLNSILDSMSDGVIVVDKRGIITTFNRAAQATLRLTPECIVGRPFAEVFQREFARNGAGSVRELRDADGLPVSTAERDSPIADRSGTRIGAVKVFQDLRELEALRQQLRQRDRLAAIGEMAATVAHEIRNPLGGIQGFAALLRRDIEVQDPKARLVEKILAGTRSLERVVNELLDYTRPVELDLKPVRCDELVDGALGYLDLGNTAVTIATELPELTVVVDAGKMRQVLLNILLNAQQGLNGAGKITVTARKSGRDIVISVADTGCGIREEHLGRVFSPFFTTKEKGTGLGLAVAARIVESHGGSLSVESVSGRGAVFSIHLPRGEQ